MGEEVVTVLANGMPFTGFKRIRVRRKFTHAAGAFHLTIAAEDGPYASAWKFQAGTKIDILFNGDLALRAYVDRYQPKIAEHKHADIDVSGRSISQDYIDSSAVHDTGEFVNKTVLDIAKSINHFGIEISSDQALSKVPLYRLSPGEGAARAIEKLCRSQGLWQSGQPDGSIKLTVAGAARNEPLVEGRNIISATADHNWSNRHSHVIVRGQGPSGDQKTRQFEARAQDDNLQRYRPIILVQDDDTDDERVKRRAHHRRDAEAGNALRAHAVVQGFHDDAGALWNTGNLTFLDSPFLAIAQDMAVDAVDFDQQRGHGSRTTLGLVDPPALGSKGARKGGRGGGAWKSGAGKL